MKICKQPFHYAERKSWNNKQVGVGLSGDNKIGRTRFGSALRRVFERADHGRADSEDGPAGCTRGLDASCSVRRNFIRFGMHHMTFERFAMNGLKRAEAYVQSQLANLHT